MTQDLVLFRRMRGLFWGALLFGVIVFPVGMTFAIAFPAAFLDPSADYLSDIGTANVMFSLGLGVLMMPAIFVAVLLGATAGSVDFQRGVLRDLVLTGRSRASFPVRRMLAALSWHAIFSVVSLTLLVILALTMAPFDGAFDWGAAGKEAAQLIPLFVVALVFGGSVALLVGSRGPAIGIFFLFVLVIDNILMALPKVGDVWENISFSQSYFQVADWMSGNSGDGYANSNGAAAAVLACWTIIPFVLGLLRYQARDL